VDITPNTAACCSDGVCEASQGQLFAAQTEEAAPNVSGIVLKLSTIALCRVARGGALSAVANLQVWVVGAKLRFQACKVGAVATEQGGVGSHVRCERA
jgi:hypothetical protein